MRYKVRMLVSGGDLESGQTYWAEEFPSNPDWMFAGNLRLPKSLVNRMFVYEGLNYVIPGVNSRIRLNETNRGYEAHISGIQPFHLDKYTHKTIYLSKHNIYITLKHEGDRVTHKILEGIAQEYA